MSNIDDVSHSVLDDNIRRARSLLSAGADHETAIEVLITSGVSADDAFLAVSAAAIIDKDM